LKDEDDKQHFNISIFQHFYPVNCEAVDCGRGVRKRVANLSKVGNPDDSYLSKIGNANTSIFTIIISLVALGLSIYLKR